MTVLILGATGKVASSENYRILDQFARQNKEQLYLSSRAAAKINLPGINWVKLDPYEKKWSLSLSSPYRLIVLLGEKAPKRKDFWKVVFNNLKAQFPMPEHVSLVVGLSSYLHQKDNEIKASLESYFSKEGVPVAMLCCSGFFSDYRALYRKVLSEEIIYQYQDRADISPVCEKDVLKAVLKLSKLKHKGRLIYYGKDSFTNQQIFDFLSSLSNDLERRFLSFDQAPQRIKSSQKLKLLKDYHNAKLRCLDLGIAAEEDFFDYLKAKL